MPRKTPPGMTGRVVEGGCGASLRLERVSTGKPARPCPRHTDTARSRVHDPTEIAPENREVHLRGLRRGLRRMGRICGASPPHVCHLSSARMADCSIRGPMARRTRLFGVMRISGNAGVSPRSCCCLRPRRGSPAVPGFLRPRRQASAGGHTCASGLCRARIGEARGQPSGAPPCRGTRIPRRDDPGRASGPRRANAPLHRAHGVHLRGLPAPPSPFPHRAL